MRELITMFVAIFVAELGDKTQLATMLFASEKKMAPLAVFAASASALVLSSAIAVLLGAVASKYLAALPLKLIAGVGFIAIGFLTVIEHFRAGS